jgi:hypothetical protein
MIVRVAREPRLVHRVVSCESSLLSRAGLGRLAEVSSIERSTGQFTGFFAESNAAVTSDVLHVPHLVVVGLPFGA